MANTVKVLRVEKKDIHVDHWFNPVSQFEIGIGPYTYLKWINKCKPEMLKDPCLFSLERCLSNNEPWSKRRHIKGFVRLAKIGLPATFISNRPGPKEDPYLRTFMMTDWKKTKHLYDSPYVYGFSDRDQLNFWFDDRRERQLLDYFGFIIKSYKVKKAIHGLRQAVFSYQDIVSVCPMDGKL